MSRLALLFLLPPLCGCYILTQAQGQLRVLLNSERIDTLLADRSVPDEVKLKLLLVREIKAFGEHELGLKRSSNYESVYDTKGQPITYIVSACRKDRFEPYLWWFPIVGEVAYQYIRQNDRRGEVLPGAGNTGVYTFHAHLFGAGVALTF